MPSEARCLPTTAQNTAKTNTELRARKKPKEESRRRGSVVQAVAENVCWQDRLGRSLADFDRGGFNDAEISTWRDPLGSISVEVLTPGLGRLAVNGFYGVRLRSTRSPKTSCDTECQRANSNDDQHPVPSALTNPTMF